MSRANKQEIITFKADASLTEALSGIGNRSDFIRAAILAALDNVCPLCQGTGVMSAHQRKHWARFAENHGVAQCDQCQAVHLICGKDSDEARPAH